MKRTVFIISALAIGIASQSLIGASVNAHGNTGLQGGTLEAVLGEWSMGFREMRAKDGDLSIHVVNKGRRRHDLTIRSKGGGREYYKTPMLDTKAAMEFSLNLPPGEYEVFCSLPGHARAGMRATLKVGG
jgi:plastocyanin